MSLLTSVPVSDVRPDPKQPRTYFKESALRALAASIKKAGQRQPITVRERKPGAKPRYEIIDGERRWRACKLAGIATIRIDIETADLSQHASQHLLSLASNFMREGHTHMEISHALHYQVEAATAAGETRASAIQTIMEAIGKSDAYVYQYLQLQGLCAALQDLMHPDVPDKTRLRFNEAVLLSSQPEAKQKAMYRAMLRSNPAARMECIRKLVANEAGGVRERKQGDIKAKTTRFIAKVSAEVERMLDYKQSDFRKALSTVPPVEIKAFRANLAYLLAEIDVATEVKSRG